MAKDLTALIKSITKDLGASVVISQMSEVETPYHMRVPFGIMDLDAAMCGGWPRGTVNQLFGPDGTGKNLLVNHNMAQVQHIFGDDSNILYMTFGYRPDVDFMRKCGVKIRKTRAELEAIGVDPSKATVEQLGEQIGNVYFLDISSNDEANEHPAESLFTAAVRLIESGEFQLVVIDEMASGETKDDVVKGLHENVRMATWASLVTNFVKKVYTALRHKDVDDKPNGTCIVVLQPVRANTDAYSSKFNPWVIPSGHALKHAKAIDVHLSPAGYEVKGSDREKIGKKIKWKISKGKFGLSEGAEGEFTFLFYDAAGNGGIDLVRILANTAKAYECITRRGANHYILDYDESVSGGFEGVIEYMKKHPEVAEEVRLAVLRAVTTGEVV